MDEEYIFLQQWKVCEIMTDPNTAAKFKEKVCDKLFTERKLDDVKVLTREAMFSVSKFYNHEEETLLKNIPNLEVAISKGPVLFKRASSFIKEHGLSLKMDEMCEKYFAQIENLSKDSGKIVNYYYCQYIFFT